MAEDAAFEQRTSKRGGVRRGRPNDPNAITDLHVRITKETHEALLGIADGERCTRGEIVDKLVRMYLRKLERKAA